MSNIPVQRVDYSDESYVRSLNITSEQIKKMLYTSNGDGTYNVAIDFLHHKLLVIYQNLEWICTKKLIL